MARIIAVIPARCGSKSLPDKNIRVFGGKPLLAHSIDIAKQVKDIERIIVSTDSQEYADIAIEYGAEVPFLRPVEFAQDDSREHDYMNHLLESLDVLPELIVHLPPPAPSRTVSYVETAIDIMRNSPNATSLASIDETPFDGARAKVVHDSYLKDYHTGTMDMDLVCGNRQSKERTYHVNGYVSILRPSVVMAGGFFGDKVIAFKTPYVVDIDTREDFEYAEYKARKKYLA